MSKSPDSEWHNSKINWRSRIVKYGKIRADQVTPHPNNPRKHPIAQRQAVEASFDVLGQIAPILINIRNGYLVDGEERTWLALSQGDETELDVVWIDLSEEEHALALASFDWITQMAYYDRPILESLLEDIETDNAALQSLLDDLAAANDIDLNDTPLLEDQGPQIDRAAELQEKWQVAHGDVWLIDSKTGKGVHRLMCGDSTNAEDVARLMGGVKADAVVADPPYGMNLDTDYSKYGNPFEGKYASHSYDAVIGDNKKYNPSHIFESWGYCKDIFLWGADYYAELIPRREDGSWLVWDKRDDGNLDEMFGSAFELCWSKKLHKREIIRVRWGGVFGTETQDIKKRIHPNQKPLQVISWILERYTKNIVVDPFLGSGTTMIAAEMSSRICYGLEISENYCAVILQRCADMGLSIRKDEA